MNPFAKLNRNREQFLFRWMLNLIANMQSDYETFTDLMYNLKYQQTNMGTLYLSKMMLVFRNEKGKIIKVYTNEFISLFINDNTILIAE
ncbi:hypothetical protein [Algoriella sp.]|uniref:hypothetical protein n=1 Tax=Algoriella sp. TaxID=1872434 RepID=UPI002FC69A94